MSAEVEEEAWSPPSSCLPSTTLAGIRPAGLALTSSPQDLFQSPLYPAHLPSRPELELIAGLLGYLGEVKEDMEEEVARTPAQQEEKKKGKRKRGRVELRRIEDRTSRQVRFSKRRSGLFKKAYELSVLCDAQVALVVFSPAGRLYEFASSDSSVEEIFGRYWDLANTINDLNIEARDNSRIEWNIQKEQLATSSVSDQLYSIARCAMEANVKEMNMAEIRGFEETVTDALTVIRNKLMMKVARLPQT